MNHPYTPDAMMHKYTGFYKKTNFTIIDIGKLCNKFQPEWCLLYSKGTNIIWSTSFTSQFREYYQIEIEDIFERMSMEEVAVIIDILKSKDSNTKKMVYTLLIEKAKEFNLIYNPHEK